MPSTILCDVAIVGGGLAGSLTALALHARRPDLDVRVIEGGETFGGHHLWSFFGADVLKPHRPLIAPIVAHAWPDFSTPSSARGLASRSGRSCGAAQATIAIVAAASTATTPKPQRQPSACPKALASGTPTMVATVSPSITRPIAWVRFSGGTSDAATKAAIPK